MDQTPVVDQGQAVGDIGVAILEERVRRRPEDNARERCDLAGGSTRARRRRRYWRVAIEKSR